MRQTVREINVKNMKILKTKQHVGVKKIQIILKKYLNRIFSYFKRSMEM